MQVGYQDIVREAFVTRAAVCMGVTETGMRTGHRAHTISLWVRIENRYVCGYCRAIRKVLACNKTEIY